MQKFFREFYAVGIIFFYYIKWLIIIGLPILYYALDYKQNMIMNILWIYCFALIIKDFVVMVILKKRYGEEEGK